MPLIPWKSFSDFDRFFDDEWFLPIVPRSGQNMPAMDVYETDKNVVAKINIPGYDPKQIDISVKNGVLKVSGKMEEKKEEKEKGYWKKEIRSGSFERVLHLPVAVEEDATDATYEKGVLKITIPKKEARTESKFKINIKEI